MRAVMMLVLARRTSMTRTEMPASGIAPAPLAVRATSMRTRSAPEVAQSADLQAQGAQVDEALGVALAVDAVGLEGREGRPVERAGRAAPPVGGARRRRPPDCRPRSRSASRAGRRAPLRGNS